MIGQNVILQFSRQVFVERNVLNPPQNKCMNLFYNLPVFNFQALESDLSSRDEKFLAPLLNLEKFRWMTVAAASVGKLPNLIRGLVKYDFKNTFLKRFDRKGY